MMRLLLNMTAMTAMTALLFACGGGGSSSSGASSIAYSGVTDPAVVTYNNASDISAAAYTSSSTSGTGGFIAALQVDEGDAKPSVAPSLDIPALLATVAEAWGPDILAMQNTPAHAVSVGTENIFCENEGGYAELSISLELDGTVIATMVPVNCQMGGVIMNGGSLGLSGDIEGLQSETPTGSYDFEYNLVTFEYPGGDKITTAGTAVVSLRAGGYSSAMNMVALDVLSGKTLKLENYVVTVTENLADAGGSYSEVGLGGTFYHPDYGYVNITTLSALKLRDGVIWPYEGILQFDGASSTWSKVDFSLPDPNGSCSDSTTFQL